MPRYSIEPQDLAHAREFLDAPIGYKSPGLQRLLNLMRGLGPEGKYVLLCREPYRRWGLAQLPARRGAPVIEIAGVEYDDLIEAERDVFRRRWRDLTGHDLDAQLRHG